MPPFTIFLQFPVYRLLFTAYKVCVNTGFGNQLLVLAFLYYTPAVYNKDLIRMTDGFQSVRNHNYCFVTRQCLNSLLQSILIFGVNICGCLVKNNNRCVLSIARAIERLIPWSISLLSWEPKDTLFTSILQLLKLTLCVLSTCSSAFKISKRWFLPAPAYRQS